MSILSNCLGFSFSSTHCVCRYLMSHAIGTLKKNLYFKGKKGYFVNKTARFSTNIWKPEPKYVLLKRSRYSWDKNECVIYFWVHRIILYFFFFLSFLLPFSCGWSFSVSLGRWRSEQMAVRCHLRLAVALTRLSGRLEALTRLTQRLEALTRLSQRLEARRRAQNRIARRKIHPNL